MNLMLEENLPKEIILKEKENEESESKIPQKGDSARGSSTKRRYFNYYKYFLIF